MNKNLGLQIGEKENELQAKENKISSLERQLQLNARQVRRLGTEIRGLFNELQQNRSEHKLAIATMSREHQDKIVSYQAKIEEFQAMSDFLA